MKTIDEIWSWLNTIRAASRNRADLHGCDYLKAWAHDANGNLYHTSRKFFTVIGVRSFMPGREVETWDQPIINQPEIGILGILVKTIDGERYFLMQAKAEPGNINDYQISPTVQATRSNYTQAHGGTVPLFTDVFLNRAGRVIHESHQSEEGGRFWRKQNLNIILEVGPEEHCEVPDNFCWMTLPQIKQLIQRDNTVNICARTVLACLP